MYIPFHSAAMIWRTAYSEADAVVCSSNLSIPATYTDSLVAIHFACSGPVLAYQAFHLSPELLSRHIQRIIEEKLNFSKPFFTI